MAVNIETAATAVPMFTGRHRMLLWVVLATLLVTGLWLRLYHITDPPLDFHAQRQYWDANRARLMYFKSLEGTLNSVPRWQMEIAQANAGESTEPPILETLAVMAYHVAGHENLALPRGIAATCFVIGGLFLFLLALRLFSPLPAFVALGYYLFLPFAVQSTRTFQPDPLMTALVCAGLFFLYRYTERQTLGRLLTAIPFVMLALYAKPMSAFFVVIPFAALMLGRLFAEKDRLQRRRLFPPSHVAIFIGAVLLSLLWYLRGFWGGSAVAQQAEKTHIPALFHQAAFWKGWLMMLGVGTVQYWALALGLLGVIFCRERKARWLLAGGWLGYLGYFYVFNYHVETHSYYNLPLVPIVALSLGALVSAGVALLTAKFTRFSLPAAVVFWITFTGILSFSIAKTAKLQVHPEYAQLQFLLTQIGERVGHTRKAVFLSYGYGDPLKYHGMMGGGWWPTQVDLAVEPIRGAAPRTAAERLRGYLTPSPNPTTPAEVFIVDPTMFEEFEMQPELKKLLIETFPIIDQPPASPCWIFDLTHPRKPLPER